MFYKALYVPFLLFVLPCTGVIKLLYGFQGIMRQ